MMPMRPSVRPRGIWDFLKAGSHFSQHRARAAGCLLCGWVAVRWQWGQGQGPGHPAGRGKQGLKVWTGTSAVVRAPHQFAA